MGARGAGRGQVAVAWRAARSPRSDPGFPASRPARTVPKRQGHVEIETSGERVKQRRVERIAAELNIVLVVAVGTTSILAIADGFFTWNLLDGLVERLAGFLIAALAVALAGTTLLTSRLALRRIADALEASLPAAADERSAGER